MTGVPERTEATPYYFTYIDRIISADIVSRLESQLDEVSTFLSGISEEKSLYRYAPGKWTIREVVGHMIDAERVFAYRALSFARGEGAALPSFDENEWAATSNAGGRTLKELVDEFAVVRAATLALFHGFSDKGFARSGVASNNHITVRAIAYIVAGHEHHHVNILRERYGVESHS